MSEAYETPPTGAVGWLFGSVPAAGYRRLRNETTATDYGITAGTTLPTFLNLLDSLTPWTWGTAADGRIQITAGTGELVWLDRLGWLLGFDREGRQSEGVIAPTFVARQVSPALIPLFSRTYERIDRERERQLVVTRFGRPHGYVYGAVDVWRWQLRVHKTGLAALRTGLCQKGKVILTPYTMAQHRAGSATAWSTSNPGGAVVCRVLGLEGDPVPIDKLKTKFDLRLLTTTYAGS